MKRKSYLSQLIFALIVCAMGALFISGQLVTGRATVAQDPNATLPTKTTRPPKATPPTRKTTPPRKNTPARQSSCSAQSPTQATGRTHTVNLNGGVGLEMVEIPTGSFCMGSTNGIP